MSFKTDPSFRDNKKNETSILTPFQTIIFSLIKKATFAVCIYYVGFHQCSIFWLAIPVLVIIIAEILMEPDEEKINSKEVKSLAGDKELISSQCSKLSPLVFFPDVEKAEWLNRIISQIWPILISHVRIFLQESVEPLLEYSLGKYLLIGFEFHTINLGSISPKFTGLKVYEESCRDQISMDVNFLYGGDCEFTFGLGGLTGGIKNFQIEGAIQVVVKPLIPSMPLIGGIQLFFIDNPHIDFHMVGVTKLLDMPGIKNQFRQAIGSLIESVLVIPNMFCFELIDDADVTANLRIPDPCGVLRVHVIEAKDLMAEDFNKRSDPYIIMSIGAQKFRTQTIPKTLNPTFDYWCEFVVVQTHGLKLRFQLWDEDAYRPDDKIGNTFVDVQRIMEQKHVDTWLTLDEVEHGSIRVQLFWFSLTERMQDLKVLLKDNKKNIHLNSAVLIVFVDSAINLISNENPPDTYVKLKVGSETRTTQIFKCSVDPIWREGISLLVGNPYNDILNLVIIDSKSKLELGGLNFPVKQVLIKKNLQFDKQPFKLAEAQSNSKIILSLRLKIMTLNDVSDSPLYSFLSILTLTG